MLLNIVGLSYNDDITMAELTELRFAHPGRDKGKSKAQSTTFGTEMDDLTSSGYLPHDVHVPSILYDQTSIGQANSTEQPLREIR